jgi:ferric-dicitrate binding protein FerR (iron transport regulator)
MDDQLDRKIEKLIQRQKSMDAEEVIGEAVGIIRQIRAIESDQAFDRVMQRSVPKTGKLRLLNILTRVAAMLFVPLLIYTVWSSSVRFPFGMEEQSAMQELSSPPAIRSQVSLPDGTKVWLNAESSIRFQVPFLQDQRQVELTGEAFFDVVKNEKLPFVVQAGIARIEVLGTKFNCKAYQHENQIDVILVEGKVKLRSVQNGETGKELLMKPNEHVILDKEGKDAKVFQEDIDKYIAWHQNRLVFDNNTLDEVAVLLERWYGIDVIIRDQEIRSFRYTTTFQNESLQQVLELLCLSTPIQSKYVPVEQSGQAQRPVLYLSKKM